MTGTQRPVRVLGIETSCDETGTAIYCTREGLLAQALHSQIALHADYGGVVPELASRDHVRRTVPLVRKVLADARLSVHEIDAIACTEGPGLAGALLVGISVGHGLAYALGRPILGVHHLEAHLLSPMMTTPAPTFPFIALLVSGGHSQIMRVTEIGEYTLLGETLDDAAGEAFDKTAKLLGLGYPGGPALARLADRGMPCRYRLPRPMIASGDLELSFSGLKTAVLTEVRRRALSERDRADLAAEFQEAIVEVLAAKCLAALEQEGLDTLVVAGGVGANRRLRAHLTERASAVGARVFYPPLDLCTDNGAMVAFAAARRIEAFGLPAPADPVGYTVRPRWGFDALDATVA